MLAWSIATIATIAPMASSVLRESAAPLLPVVGLIDSSTASRRSPRSRSRSPRRRCPSPCSQRALGPVALATHHSATCSTSSPSSTTPSSTQVPGFRGLSNCGCGFGSWCPALHGTYAPRCRGGSSDQRRGTSTTACSESGSELRRFALATLGSFGTARLFEGRLGATGRQSLRDGYPHRRNKSNKTAKAM